MSQRILEVRLAVAAARAAEGLDAQDLDVVCRDAAEIDRVPAGAAEEPRVRLIAGALRESGGHAKKAVAKLLTLPGSHKSRIVFYPWSVRRRERRLFAWRMLKLGIVVAIGVAILSEAIPSGRTTGLESLPVEKAVERALDDLERQLEQTKAEGKEVRSLVQRSMKTASSSTHAAEHAPSESERSAAATKRLLSWARRSLRVRFERTCPPPEKRADADYRASDRRVRLCPELEGTDELRVVAHELAHALQGLRRRLNRKSVEVEADGISRIAVLAAGFDVPLADFPYLSKPGDHASVLRESRAPIEAMAVTLASVMRGEEQER